MYLKWINECYSCSCPLNPRIHTNDVYERNTIREYRKIRPIFMFNNEEYYKFFGSKLKRVCYPCFLNSYKIHPSTLRKREYGMLKQIYKTPKSKTKEELLYWFEGLKRHLSRRSEL
jgi:hypothetical protein